MKTTSVTDQRQLPVEGPDEYWANEWYAAHEFVYDLYQEIKLLLAVDPLEHGGPHVECAARRMQVIADFAVTQGELGCIERALLEDLRAAARKRSRRNRALAVEFR